MRLHGIWFMAFAAALVLRTTPIANSAQEERWIEVLEQYQVPHDPHWHETAVRVAEEFGVPADGQKNGKSTGQSRGRGVRPGGGLGRPGGEIGGSAGNTLSRFRAATGSNEQWSDFKRRMEQAGDNQRSREAVVASIEREIERIVNSASAERELTIVRAWDGIARQSVVFILGEKQRATAGKCKVGSVLFVETGASNCADHAQANGNPTLLSAKSKAMPSEFLKASEGSPEVVRLQFGEVDCPSDWRGLAKKSESVGSGDIEVVFELPAAAGVDDGHPWWCGFRLMELDSTGNPAREVQFTGPAEAVCVSTRAKPMPDELQGLTGRRQPSEGVPPARPTYHAAAKARIRVTNPGPHGYVAIATTLRGVRRQSTPNSMPTSTESESR